MCALNLPGFPVGSKKYTAVSTIPKDANLAGFSVPKENRVCTKPARFSCWEQETHSCFNNTRRCKPGRFFYYDLQSTLIDAASEEAA
ncbi:hypothetical protein [Algoriphagus sp. AGSA1]|uniref:hypothetical protein n=1 Tax=Algoriphagus sp. AGSA1 TaxID=2907213 RepID=UPI001F1FF851|nr:hypothetical protein [Algoriphagus sp. AGSA1]